MKSMHGAWIISTRICCGPSRTVRYYCEDNKWAINCAVLSLRASLWLLEQSILHTWETTTVVQTFQAGRWFHVSACGWRQKPSQISAEDSETEAFTCTNGGVAVCSHMGPGRTNVKKNKNLNSRGAVHLPASIRRRRRCQLPVVFRGDYSLIKSARQQKINLSDGILKLDIYAALLTLTKFTLSQETDSKLIISSV